MEEVSIFAGMERRKVGLEQHDRRGIHKDDTYPLRSALVTGYSLIQQVRD